MLGKLRNALFRVRGGARKVASSSAEAARSGASAAVYDRVPCNEPLIYAAEFVSDDLDY